MNISNMVEIKGIFAKEIIISKPYFYTDYMNIYSGNMNEKIVVLCDFINYILEENEKIPDISIQISTWKDFKKSNISKDDYMIRILVFKSNIDNYDILEYIQGYFYNVIINNYKDTDIRNNYLNSIKKVFDIKVVKFYEPIVFHIDLLLICNK